MGIPQDNGHLPASASPQALDAPDQLRTDPQDGGVQRGDGFTLVEEISGVSYTD